jgi:uncharacterized protein YodC (DUF2158 family)
MTEVFKVGDIVQLKSGGPKMTVVGDLKDEEQVYTAWFVEGKKETASFPHGAIVLCTDQRKT